MSTNVSSSTVVIAIVLAAVASVLADKETRADQIVLPAGSADTEGAWRFAGSLPSTPNGGRVQELQLASEFLALGTGPFQLGSLALRPDNTVTSAHSFTWDIRELILSTTPAATLSPQFEMNRSTDATTVFTGELTLETDGRGPPEGPRNFDYVIDFDRAFTYDPNEGNLLVEWVFGPNVGNSVHDGLTTATARIVYNFEDSAAASGEVLNRVSAMRFSIVPEPSTFLISVTGLLSLVCLRRLST